MSTSAWARIVTLVALFCAAITSIQGQATVGSVSGSILDPSGAVMPNVNITLTNQAQGAASAREVKTNNEGIFVFTPVLPGNYTLAATMAGFKQFVQQNIVVNVADRVGLPPISLEVGAATESITVEAQAVRLETETAERSGVVTGKQMVDLGLNGRNFTGLLKTVPGVSADQGGGSATINGLRNDQNNFTVDGQTVTDIGVNQQFAYRINVDAIAEFKVSTSSQGAEFGRNAGAQIQVVTRSGTKDFHGTGYWFKRGEFMNANNFINNASNTPKPAYRFMTAGFTAGGPIYIPGKMNVSKDKLFGFMSNEWNRSFTPGAIRQITVPTALERAGDFSQTRDAAGVIQIIKDPTTGLPFPGNVIPANRFSPYGPSILNWLPLPNISGQLNYNYQSQVANSAPSYDQIYRVDWNISDNWRFYGRHLNSKQTQNNPYGRADSGNNLGISPLYAPTYGWSLAANLVTLLGPTMTNEFQFGYTVNGIPGDAPVAGSPYYRSVSNINIPLLFPNADPIGLIPNFNFGGVPPGSNGTQVTSFAGLPYANRNPVWNYTDNFTKIAENHTIKFGLFIETATKTENPFRAVNGTINFGRDNANPNDSNWAFSNALLGNFQTYSQFNQLITASYPYRNVEFYGQDTWKVTKKLTINYGLRISFIKPFHDTLGKMANFDYDAYDPTKAVRFYQPVLVGGVRLGQNPNTGEIVPAALISAIAPGFGDINNGMVLSGQGNTPEGLIENRGAHWGPRLGVAYALNSKTVLRAGGGVFYDRIATFGIGVTSNYVTNPPSTRQSDIWYGNLATIGAGGATNFPAQVTRMSPDGHVPTVYNFNAGVQRDIGFKTTLEVSYVGSQSRHNYLAQPFNAVPFGSAWQPYSQDPTRGTPQFDGSINLPTNMYRPIPGYNGGTDWTWGGSSNYNALQISANRRASTLQYGVAYTWSKALGVTQGHITNARQAYYGPLGLDRTQSLSFNYLYDIPSLANHVKFVDNAVGKAIVDNWQFTGITSISSGAPTNITYNVSGIGGAQLNRQVTGSEDVAPRVVFTCDPNRPGPDRTIDVFVNTQCIAMAPKGSQGMDSGYNRLRGPGLHNWDMSVFKNIPFAENKVRVQLRLEAYNVFNHTQWGGFNSTATFNASTGKVINLPVQTVAPGTQNGGRYGFGALNSVRANSQRILQIAVKLYF